MKNSPIILFLHGALGTSQDFLPLMETLKDKGVTLLSFDFSGHGKKTSWPEEFRIDFFARELDNYIKKNDLTNLTIFGHSMGAYIALYHQAHFEPSPISKIFSYGTKFNWSEQSVSKELPMLNPENLLQKYPAFAASLENKHGERWKSLLLSTAHMMQNLQKLDGLTSEDVADIEIPILLMLGDQDRMVSTEETILTKQWIKHADFRMISHSKHEMERANLKEIGQVILENLMLN